MASKFDGDVRPLSNDQRYMGVVFSGPIDEAIAQAKAAPDHGLSEQYVPVGMSRNRAVLLEHLNLLNAEHGGFVAHSGPSKYSLASAMARWPESFYRAPAADQSIADRIRNLNESQLHVYAAYRTEFSILTSLTKAEAFPYPVPPS